MMGVKRSVAHVGDLGGLRHLGTELRRLAAASALAIVVAGSGGQSASAWEMSVCADPGLLPFSSIDETGFDNRIAKLLAEAVDATVEFVWTAQSPDMISLFLRVGKCDVIVGVQDGQEGLLTTLAYYRSPIVFIQRAGRPYNVSMFDDPALRELRIGIQHAGSPAYEALLNRGMRGNITRIYEYQLTHIIDDIAKGEIDVGLAWGPTAGYFAALQTPPLLVSPVTPEFEPPFRPMFINIAVGVRIGDESLRDLLDIAIAKQWDAIIAILEEYHAPTMPLQRPMVSEGGR